MGIYAVASDGTLHTLGQSEGKDIQKPAPFLPANANVTDMIAVNQVLHAATTNGCGGVPNGLWAVDLDGADKTVTSWKNAASPVGAPALASNGMVYAAMGDGSSASGSYSDAAVALDPKTLRVKDSLSSPCASFVSTPTIFKYGDREIAAVIAKDGRVFLPDTESFGGANHNTALYTSAATTTSKSYAPSALATWEDSEQTRWLLVPAAGAKSNVLAFKVTGDAEKPSLQHAWVSRELVSPAALVVVNGIVFALSTGEYIPAVGSATVAEKISKSTPAVLYALEASTGNEPWNSGKSITSFTHSGGLWASDGQVYVPTYDSNVYAFRFCDGTAPLSRSLQRRESRLPPTAGIPAFPNW